MSDTNPDPDNQAPSDQELHSSLQQIRYNLAVLERARAIKQQLGEDWELYRGLAADDAERGASPVSKLKVEAIATIATLGEFHCRMAHCLAEEGEHRAAHAWAVDEGILQAAGAVLNRVDTESL
jgi:hypothetical protein